MQSYNFFIEILPFLPFIFHTLFAFYSNLLISAVLAFVFLQNLHILPLTLRNSLPRNSLPRNSLPRNSLLRKLENSKTPKPTDTVSCPNAARRLPVCCPKAARRLSEGCPNAARRLPEGCPKADANKTLCFNPCPSPPVLPDFYPSHPSLKALLTTYHSRIYKKTYTKREIFCRKSHLSQFFLLTLHTNSLRIHFLFLLT